MKESRSIRWRRCTLARVVALALSVVLSTHCAARAPAASGPGSRELILDPRPLPPVSATEALLGAGAESARAPEALVQPPEDSFDAATRRRLEALRAPLRRWQARVDPDTFTQPEIGPLAPFDWLAEKVVRQCRETLPGGTRRWSADLEGGGYAELLERGGLVEGRIYLGERSFEVRPIGLWEVDLVEWPMPEPLPDIDYEEGGRARSFSWLTEEECKKLQGQTGHETIGVELGAYYTPSACEAIPGGSSGAGTDCDTCRRSAVETWISKAVDSVNSALTDSKVWVRFKLVQQDCVVGGPAQSEFGAGRAWDVAVLFDGQGYGRLGRARIFPDRDEALARVKVAAALSPTELALHHELGHLLGGRHQWDMTVAAGYDHGIQVACWKSLVFDGTGNKKEWYSNPKKKVGAKPFGDWENHNNACVFVQVAAELAKYHP